MYFLIPSSVLAGNDGFAEKIINSQCKGCHRFEGKPKSKFELRAPDLMWGGVKFQRPWLVRRLLGQEDNLYPYSYRWDKLRLSLKHMILTREEAVIVADYMDQSIEISAARLIDDRSFNDFQPNIEFDKELVNLNREEPLKNELIDFLDSIGKNRKPLVTGEDGARAVEVAQAAIESLNTGNKVEEFEF